MEKPQIMGGIVLAFFFGVFMGPVHELGHYLAYTAFGYPVTFHYDSISCPISITNNIQATIITAAGWGILYLVVLASLLFVFKFGAKLVYFSPAILVSGVDAFDTIIDLLGLEHGDKSSLSVELGLSPSSVYLLALILDIIVFYCSFYFLNKSDLSNESKILWLLGTLTAGAIGVALWLFVIGPKILP
jgi:hypothetical protein